MSNYYVSPTDTGWKVKKEKAEKASGYFDTKKEAEKAAKEYSSNSGGGEVRLKGLDNKFHDSDTVAPGNDPQTSKDTKH